MKIKTKKINLRQAFKNEINDFKATIRQEWEDYGYEVSFQWIAKGEGYRKYRKTGAWVGLLDGEYMSEILKETNTGEYLADWAGYMNGTDEEVIDNIEIICGIN